jgi:predicted transcriptional regulator
MAKKYKSWELYMCLALNRLVMELDLDLYQDGLESKLEDILSRSESKLPKSEISYEIKSNYQMTNKILKKLKDMGLIKMERDEDGRSYNISITKEGVLYIRKYNEFYISMYEDIIKDHYKYRPIPSWFKIK